MNRAFSVLFICSGNRFRSPLAAAYLHRLTLGLPVAVASAGTLGVEGEPALPAAVTLAVWSGLSLGSHRSRRVRQEDVTGADLVLGFERAHVGHAVVDLGCPRDRAFTLPELVALLDDLPDVDAEPTLVGRATARIASAAAARGADAPPEVTDPYGRSRRVAERVAAEIQALTIRLAEGLVDARGSDVFPPSEASGRAGPKARQTRSFRGIRGSRDG